MISFLDNRRKQWINYQLYTYYPNYPNGYLGYPNRTFGGYGTWHLEYKQKGQPIQVVDINESLTAALVVRWQSSHFLCGYL